MKSYTDGQRAWLGLVLYIMCYDIWAARSGRETLSMAFYEAIQHPARRWPTIAIWSFITAHLFKFIPDNYDPLRLPWKMHYLRSRDKIILIVKRTKDT